MSIAREILMFRSEYDQHMERVAELREQIAKKSEVVNKAVNAVYEKMIAMIEQQLANGDLQKSAGPHSLLKSANANAREEMQALQKLQGECIQAQARANDAFSGHVAHLSEMRVQIPAGAPRYFSTSKGGAVTPLPPLPGTQPTVDPNKALFDVQLARRFQDREQQ